MLYTGKYQVYENIIEEMFSLSALINVLDDWI